MAESPESMARQRSARQSSVRKRGRAEAVPLASTADDAPRLFAPPSVSHDVLAARMQAVGRLAEGISHEFNNLLTSILGFAYLISEDSPPEDPRKSYAQEIIGSGERAAELIRQMLEFSRKHSARFERVRLHEVLQAECDVFAERLPPSISLNCRWQAKEDRIWADPDKIKELLRQLLQNAVDAMPAGGVITLSSHVETTAPEGGIPSAARCFVLQVIDQGEGIPARIREKIFDPFFSTRAVGQRTGLGLSIAYNHVEQHQGRILVSDTPGGGTTFSIMLPLREGTASKTRPEAVPDSELPQGEGRVVLLIDDDDSVRRAAAGHLKALRYRVLHAPNAPEAEHIALRQERVDAIMMDLSAQALNASSMAVIREHHPDARVLYFSGYDGQSHMSEGRLDESLSNFLPKPFTRAKLALALWRALV